MMMSWLQARWAERSTRLALGAVLGFAAAYLHGDIGGETAALSIGYALLHAVVPDNPLVTALGQLAGAATSGAATSGAATSGAAKPAFALALVGAALGLSACAGGGAVSLTPTQTTLAQVGCALDGAAQPIALPMVAGVPTVGGVAATVDAALVHPLVVAECAKLNAKPVALPAAPPPALPAAAKPS
jgi:hypothetical protein